MLAIEHRTDVTLAMRRGEAVLAMTEDAFMRPPTARILLVDDDETLARSLARLLRIHGHQEVEICSDLSRARDVFERFGADLVVLDLIMPGIRGQRLLENFLRVQPDLAVIVLTADYDPRVAVECMRLGAKDFLQKPVRADELLASINRALEASAIRFEADALRSQFFATELKHPEAFADIVTRDPKMFRIFAYIEAIGRGSQPVLIRGETGTGKERIARAIHRVSGRKGSFVAVNVAGLDDELFSDTLFGHVRGAFTGAERDRTGMMERARGGTLLLDEIGDLSEASQIKLLRVLQEREFTPIGSDDPRPLEARIVAATHHPANRLRGDLYFRLRAYQVEIPPLRERIGDLPLLVGLFLTEAAEDLGRERVQVPEELYVDLSNEPFPGNVRELRAIVFDAVARHDRGTSIPIRHFDIGRRKDDQAEPVHRSNGGITFPHPMPSLKDVEREAIQEALRRVGGNRSAAARMLGVSRPTILKQIAAPNESADSAGDEP